MDENFFFKIEDAVEFRRNILESSRLILEKLKRYEDFGEFLEQKKLLINDLKKKVEEINNLIGGLQKELPASRLGVSIKKEKPKLVLSVKPSKLEELERDLEEIESRLKRLE